MAGSDDGLVRGDVEADLSGAVVLLGAQVALKNDGHDFSAQADDVHGAGAAVDLSEHAGGRFGAVGVRGGHGAFDHVDVGVELEVHGHCLGLRIQATGVEDPHVHGHDAEVRVDLVAQSGVAAGRGQEVNRSGASDANGDRSGAQWLQLEQVLLALDTGRQVHLAVVRAVDDVRLQPGHLELRLQYRLGRQAFTDRGFRVGHAQHRQRQGGYRVDAGDRALLQGLGTDVAGHDAEFLGGLRVHALGQLSHVVFEVVGVGRHFAEAFVQDVDAFGLILLVDAAQVVQGRRNSASQRALMDGIVGDSHLRDSFFSVWLRLWTPLRRASSTHLFDRI